jgi:tetratricopeptide (TPR) repeat protein
MRRLLIAWLAVTALVPIGAAAQTGDHLKQRPADTASLVVAARTHLARGEHSAAYDLLRTAQAADPRNVEVLRLLGVVSSELATREFDRLYKLAPEGARVHQLMAQAFKLQNKLGDAAAEYELALAADPRLVEAMLELAAIRREESDCERATALYRRAQAVRTTYDATYGLGLCLAAQNDHKAAVDALRAALKHEPDSASAHFAIGRSLLELGDAAGAAGELERAIALQPRMRQAYYLLGRAYRTLKLEERSRQAFAQAESLAQAERAADEKALHPKPPQ